MREFYIYEPKMRLIQAPYFEDRIVHHAILAAIQAHIQKKYYRHSYACQTGKGVHASSLKLGSWLKDSNVKYYLKLDLSKFFYSIDHNLLTKVIDRYVECQDTVTLLKLFYESQSGVGLPLGNVTSQMLANLFLTPLDNYVKRKLSARRYIRYMDDFIILGKEKHELAEMKAKISHFLTDWKLSLNPKFRIEKVSKGVDFCGFRHWQTKRLIRKKTLYRFGKAVRHQDENAIVSYLGMAKGTQSFRYMSEMTGRDCTNKIKGIVYRFIMKNMRKKNEIL